MKIKDIIKSLPFYIAPANQKETYTKDEIYQFIDELKEKAALAAERHQEESEVNIARAYQNRNSDSKALSEKIKASDATNKELTDKINNLLSRNAMLEKEKTMLEQKLIPYQRQVEKSMANELLKGMVVVGSESDVYNMLTNEQKDFQGLETIADKRARIKPFVDKILKEKTYLQPIDDGSNIANNPALTKGSNVSPKPKKSEDVKIDYHRDDDVEIKSKHGIIT